MDENKNKTLMGFSRDIDVKCGNLHTKKEGQKDLCGGKVSI